MVVYLTDPTSHQSNGAIQNLGDAIIKDAVLANLTLADHSRLRWLPLDHAGVAPPDILVLAGANVLADRPYANPYVWQPRPISLLRAKVVLFGVGWWQYQTYLHPATRILYRYLLQRRRVLHSVRDSYTRTLLRVCGVTHVESTGCPTMWSLPSVFSFDRKPKTVVFTLTDYYHNVDCDTLLIEILLDQYPELYFFPQGVDDITYLRSIVGRSQLKRIEVLERTLAAYDQLLSSGVDYVGTRLHGGIRALQRGQRAFVISVDNRAAEIAKDTHLPIVSREDLAALPAKLNTVFSFTLRINRAAVRSFRDALDHLVLECS